jgi:hypothetical protein
MTTHLSLAELTAAEIDLRPAEAVAIVAEVCRQYAGGQLRGIPPPGIIRLTRDGAVIVNGPMPTEDASVPRAARLLNDLLPPLDSRGVYRASGGLRLVIARALGTLDLPPYPTLDEFCVALGRFAAPDLAVAANSLFRAWEQHEAMRRMPTPPLTISDIRRARRATGWSLDDLSAVADVPANRLRELEWGYLRNWRADEDGRAQLVRYARAAGLDEQVVVAIAWPLIEEASTIWSTAAPAEALVPSGAQTLAPIAPVARRSRSRVASWSLAATSAALLAAATFAVATDSGPDRPAKDSAAVAALPPPAESASVRPPVEASTATVSSAPVSVSKRQAAKAGPVRRASAPKRRPEPRPPSFFRRVLFRIVIR